MDKRRKLLNLSRAIYNFINEPRAKPRWKTRLEDLLMRRYSWGAVINLAKSSRIFFFNRYRGDVRPYACTDRIKIYLPRAVINNAASRSRYISRHNDLITGRYTFTRATPYFVASRSAKSNLIIKKWVIGLVDE